MEFKKGDYIIVNKLSMYYGTKGFIKKMNTKGYVYLIEVVDNIDIENFSIKKNSKPKSILISKHCLDLDKQHYREQRFKKLLDNK